MFIYVSMDEHSPVGGCVFCSAMRGEHSDWRPSVSYLDAPPFGGRHAISAGYFGPLTVTRRFSRRAGTFAVIATKIAA